MDTQQLSDHIAWLDSEASEQEAFLKALDPHSDLPGKTTVGEVLAGLRSTDPGRAESLLEWARRLVSSGSSIAYMASKGALNAMTVGLARAVGPKVRVNAIAPGLVETPWLKNGLGERYPAYVEDYTSKAVLEDVIQPEDVADAAWWLGAGAAKTTGEVLLLDAGLRLARG